MSEINPAHNRAAHYIKTPPELWSSPACPATSSTESNLYSGEGPQPLSPTVTRGRCVWAQRPSQGLDECLGEVVWEEWPLVMTKTCVATPAWGSPPPSLLVQIRGWDGMWRSQCLCRASTESSIDESGSVLRETMYWLVKCKWRKRFFYTKNQRHTVKSMIIFLKARVNDMQDISCLSMTELGKSTFIHRSSVRLKSLLTEDQGQQTAISSPPMIPCGSHCCTARWAEALG